MTGMLASVANLDEALTVQDAGVDIIDLKAPSEGALGALDTEVVKVIVNHLRSDTLTSATIGDLPMHPEIVGPAVDRMWATGVNYVKIGLFPGGDWNSSISVLENKTSVGVRLIAVFFADCSPDSNWLPELARAGFTGVMLDTKDKRAGSLRQVLNRTELEYFVNCTRNYGLLCGLAGSLRLADIEPLLELSPDYLGFRGALCQRQDRIAQLDRNALASIRKKFTDWQAAGNQTILPSFAS